MINLHFVNPEVFIRVLYLEILKEEGVRQGFENVNNKYKMLN